MEVEAYVGLASPVYVLGMVPSLLWSLVSPVYVLDMVPSHLLFVLLHHIHSAHLCWSSWSSVVACIHKAGHVFVDS
jgi:hypothetical protein